jgi:hypothetical protein
MLVAMGTMPGEWQELRERPWYLGAVPVALLALAALTASSLPLRLLAAAAALAGLVLLLRVRARAPMERYILRDGSAAIESVDGSERLEVALGRVACAVVRTNGSVSFRDAAGGELLRFTYVRGQRRLRRALTAAGVAVDETFDLACPT